MSGASPWELMLLIVPYVWTGLFVLVVGCCGAVAAMRLPTMKVPAGLALAGLVLVGLEAITVTIYWTVSTLMQLYQTAWGSTLNATVQFLPQISTSIAIALVVIAAILRTPGSAEEAS